MKTKHKAKTLHISDIATDFDRFQFRTVKLDYGHVEELKSAYNRKAKLPPITVWQDPADKIFYVLDGHHRHAALTKLKSTKVTVRVFEGDYAQARVICLEENAKAQLPMTPEERQNASWLLTQDTREDGTWTYSKATISATCGTAERTVATMRSTYKRLQAAGKVIPEKSWKAAQMALRSLDAVEYTEDDRQAWVEAHEGKLDEAIGKQLSLTLETCSEAAFNVLIARLGDKHLAAFIDWARDGSDELDEDEEAWPF